MSIRFDGKVAIVTGAGAGLGRAHALAFAARGAKVVVNDFGGARDGTGGSSEAALAVVDEIRKAGGAAIADGANVADFDQVQAMVKRAVTEFGRVDILVNNAGGPPAGPFEKHDWEAWAAAVDLTLRSAVELTRRVLPGMRERKWGRILNVTSIAAKQPVDGLMLSNSIRAAVTGWARTLANEVARDNVTVNCILPGYTRTERVEQLNASTAAREKIEVADVLRRIEAQIPMRRLGEPAEFGALAAFLVSERASYITAQSVAVDGGWIRSLL